MSSVIVGDAVVRALQREASIYTNEEIYYEKLAHSVIKTEKSHDLLSASWRPRRAGV